MALPESPKTRREQYYSVMAGQSGTEILPEIQETDPRELQYLDYIARNGGGGGGSTVEVTQIKTSGEKIATITVDNVPTDLYASAGGGGGAVDTVNGMTGDVVLTATDVGALPDNTSIPSKTSDLTNDSNFVVDASYVHTDNNYTTAEKTKLSGIAAGADVNVQPDWSQTDTDADDYIKNKPTIPSAQVNADWTASSGVAEILNKPTLGTAATKNSTNAVTDSTDLVESGAVATALTGEDITKSATGTAITLTDSANARVQDLRIYGRTESGASVGDNGLNVRVTNANIWDEEWEPGTYYSTGEHAGEKNDTNPNRLRSKNKIAVSMSDTYYVYTTRDDITINIGCYDNDNNFLGFNYQNQGGYHNERFLLYPGTRYIVFWTYSESSKQTPYNYGITIACGSLPTEYIPYQGHTATITTALPLRSNEDVKDEIDFADGQAITRIDSNGDVLATPVITPLSATEITAFRALRTFDSVTNITATDDPYMSVTYIKNTANGEAVGAIEDDLQGQITVLNTAKQPKTLDTPITIGGTSQATVEAALGALSTAKEDAITQSATLTLTVAGWDSTTLQQTVTFAHDTTKRNVIDITVSELETWAECGVLPTGETNAGISFKCEEIPESALTFKVTSMGVTT